MLPFVSLDAAAVTGAGVVRDLETALAEHRGQGVVTGSPTAVTVALEGSLDGQTWYVIATSTSTGPTFGLVGYAGFATPARFVRANLTALSGGTSPTVTVTIGSA